MAGEDIADHDALLMDARYHAAKGEPRRAVLDMAVACEQACELAFRRIIAAKGMPPLS